MARVSASAAGLLSGEALNGFGRSRGEGESRVECSGTSGTTVCQKRHPSCGTGAAAPGASGIFGLLSRGTMDVG